MVPITEVIIDPHYITVRGHSDQQMDEVCKFLKTTVTHAYHVSPPRPLNTQQKEDEYKALVSEALADIRAEEYTKIIVSRAINLDNRVDMPSTLLHGRRHNTPARTFIMNHAGFQAIGFSPELVMSVHNGTVLTEPLAGTCQFVSTKEDNLTKPLAGTRQFVDTKEENDKLRQTLVNDPKEIVEQ
jgi:salicylate synthetase